MSSAKASLSANLLWLGGVSSVGNLTPRISKGCRTLHSGPNLSGKPSNTRGSNGSTSTESSSSPECSSICPSDIRCTHVHGLQVSVAVGLGGDPLGRKVLEDEVSGSTGSVSTGTEETGGVAICHTLTVDVIGMSDIFLLSATVLKKSLVAAKASSLLVSLDTSFLLGNSS